MRWATALASRATGVLARMPVPRPARGPVLGAVAAALRLDLSEAAAPLSDYGSVDALFTRPLAAGARSWPRAADAAGSPVDGVVGMSGRIRSGTLLQAKGRGYSAAELLGDPATAEWFQDGHYLTLYLSPRHYHRIHAPVAGEVRAALHVPGRLLPVNAPATRWVDRLFPRNERLVCVMDGTPLGPVAVVAVGAFNVGRITAAFDDRLVTNRWPARRVTRVYRPPIVVDRGAELMTFHLGSTVVLLLDRRATLAAPPAGTEVRLGDRIAT